eukprot:scaffold13656_cov147-Amphora_coffeaeformis.AAC.1
MFFSPLNCSEATRLRLACLDNVNTCTDVVPGWETNFDYTQVWIRAYGVGRNPNIEEFLVTDELLTDSENGPYFEMRYSDGDRLDSDQVIEIWTLGANGTSRGDTLLQRVTFHASCSQPLLCLNSFGSNTLVSFRNQDQSLVECLDTLRIPLLVRFPLDIGGVNDDFRIINANIRTDFTRPRVFDFALDQVGNEIYSPGDEIQFEIDALLDVRRAQELSTTVRVIVQTVGTEGAPQVECAITDDAVTVFTGDEFDLVATCDDFTPIGFESNPLIETLELDP